MQEISSTVQARKFMPSASPSLTVDMLLLQLKFPILVTEICFVPVGKYLLVPPERSDTALRVSNGKLVDTLQSTQKYEHGGDSRCTSSEFTLISD